MPPWETLPHPSDLRVRVTARDRAALLAESARSLFELSARPRGPWPDRLESVTVDARGEDDAALLHRLLAECLFQFETRGFLAKDAVVERLEPTSARVRLLGARFEPAQLDVVHVIKGVTWHGLSVRVDAGGASAEILHDL
jgi:SHS2 domain-containing protein